MNMGVGRWFCNFQTYGVRVIQFNHFVIGKSIKKSFSRKTKIYVKKFVITIDVWHKIICKNSSQNKIK
jgi:hypothetical protein